MYQSFCIHCGTRLMPQARFCHGCSAVVNFTQVPVANPTPPAPQPAVTAAAKPKPKARGRKFSAGVLFLTLVLLFSSILTLFLGELRLLIDSPLPGQAAQALLQQVDLTQIPASIFRSDADPSMSAADLLAQGIESCLPSEVSIEPEAVQQYWTHSGFIPFLANTINRSVAGVRTGKPDEPLTAADLEEVFLQDQALIEELTGRSLTREDLSALADGLMELRVLDYLQAETLQNSAPVAFYGLHLLLSDTLLKVMAVVMILAVVGMLLCRRLHLFYAMEDASIPLLASGGWFTGHLMVITVLGLGAMRILGVSEWYLLPAAMSHFLILPLSVLIVGIVMGVIGYLGDRLLRT